MRTIQFDLRTATKANEAINDNIYFEEMNQIDSCTYGLPELDEDDEEQYIDELEYQLSSWGIEKSEYEIA
jgi:hypothetical protein